MQRVPRSRRIDERHDSPDHSRRECRTRPEAGVWFVESSDLPGLNVEAPTLDGLIEVVADLAPDLIETNLPDASGRSA